MLLFGHVWDAKSDGRSELGRSSRRERSSGSPPSLPTAREGPLFSVRASGGGSRGGNGAHPRREGDLAAAKGASDFPTRLFRGRAHLVAPIELTPDERRGITEINREGEDPDRRRRNGRVRGAAAPAADVLDGLPRMGIRAPGPPKDRGFFAPGLASAVLPRNVRTEPGLLGMQCQRKLL